MKSAKEIAEKRSGRTGTMAKAKELDDPFVDKTILLDWSNEELEFLAGFDLAIEMLREEGSQDSWEKITCKRAADFLASKRGGE